MTACNSEFVVADEFDVVMLITNTDILKNDTEMLSEVNSAVKNLPSAKKSEQHHIDISSKIWLSESELLRHVILKNAEKLSPIEKSMILKCSLDIFLLTSFIEKKCRKISRRCMLS